MRGLLGQPIGYKGFFAISVMAMASFLLAATAMAADSDPFTIDSRAWKSFERYQDEAKKAAVAKPETPVETLQNTDTDAEETTKQVTLDDKPHMAPLSRPINIPLLPGNSKNYEVWVDSTSGREAEAASQSESSGAPVAVKESNWQPISEAAKNYVSEAEAKENGTEPSPLQIRLSFLPDRSVAPVASVESEKIRKQDTPAAKKIAEKAQAKQAVCAAIDAYKERQLQAIRSDQQTLAALQSAISDLGLNSELGFLTEQKNNPQTASEKRMDKPVDLFATPLTTN